MTVQVRTVFFGQSSCTASLESCNRLKFLLVQAAKKSNRVVQHGTLQRQLTRRHWPR